MRRDTTVERFRASMPASARSLLSRAASLSSATARFALPDLLAGGLQFRPVALANGVQAACALPGPHLPPAQLLAARLRGVRALGPDPLALAKEFPVDRTGSRGLRQLPVGGDARNRRRPDILDANLHAQPNSTPENLLPDLISQ